MTLKIKADDWDFFEKFIDNVAYDWTIDKGKEPYTLTTKGWHKNGLNISTNNYNDMVNLCEIMDGWHVKVVLDYNFYSNERYAFSVENTPREDDTPLFEQMEELYNRKFVQPFRKAFGVGDAIEESGED